MIRVIVFCLLPWSLWAQNFSRVQYRAADGLGTEMIKSVNQDSMGFIWIGTDDGLIRYDGISFKKYPAAAISKYFKDFIYTSDERLLAVHDLGIVEIVNHVDTVIFKVAFPGLRVPTDSTLWYPKHVFEDVHANLWISEPQSVVRWTGNEWKRFRFPEKNNSLSFVRSFNFFQWSNAELLVASNTGLFHLYDYGTETFRELSVSGLAQTIYDLKKVKNRILAATDNGIYEMTLVGETVHLKRIRITDELDNFPIRHLNVLKDQRFIACSEAGQTSMITMAGERFVAEQLPQTELLVNQSFISADSTIWLSTDRGLVLYFRPEFTKVSLPSLNTYMEALFGVPGDTTVYAMNKAEIWAINTRTFQPRRILSYLDGYFLSGVATTDGLFITSTSQLWKVQPGGPIQKLEFGHEGRFLFEVDRDPEGMIWVSQEVFSGLRRIHPRTLQVRTFGKEAGLDAEITAVKTTRDGIYAASSSSRNYLFYKGLKDSSFSTLASDFPEAYRYGLSIECLEVTTGGVVWIGTNFGLFKWDNGRLEKVKFQSAFEESSIYDLHSEGDYLWIGNALGLVKMDLRTGESFHFTENTGLPINSTNEESILIQDGKIWVGTSQGIAYGTPHSGLPLERTAKPHILEFNVDGVNLKRKGPAHGTIDYRSFVQFTFSSMTFPSKNVQYSYRFNDGEWTPVSYSTQAKVSDLVEGSYRFEVRAKREGEYAWSPVQSYYFRVNPPFYKTTVFYLLALMVVGFFIGVTRIVSRRFERVRQRQLQELVDEKTSELSVIKENLEDLVYARTAELQETLDKLREAQDQLIQSEKMASLGILTAGVAHEINNPINYVQGGLYSLENLVNSDDFQKNPEEALAQMREVTGFMQKGVDRIIHIVAGLSRFSRKSDMHRHPCNLFEIIDNCLLILNFELKEKCTVTTSYQCGNAVVMGDEGNLHQLFINLLTNAVHAIQDQGEIEIGCYPEQDHQVVIYIKDNGSGIDPKDLKKLFDPFYTTKAPGLGTGLGLYIAQKIVQDHQAEIKFDSKLGKGTTVSLKFNL